MLQKIISKLNDLRPRQLLMLAAGAAVLMFLTIYIGMSLLVKEEVAEQRPVEPPKPVIEKTAVVVAKVNMPPRTRIQENMLQIKEMPVDMVPEGAIKRFDDVLNVQLKVSIFSGDILTVQKVFSDKSAEGFVGAIPPECRAISISVNDITGVAGFAKPGDFVDLILVEKSQYSATSSILLQNVPLLSVNQDMGNNMVDTSAATGQAISNPTIATFALRPAEILKLISATKVGEIYMSLRPADPQSAYVGEMEYTTESVNAPKPEPEPVRESEPAYREPTPVIPETPLPSVPVPQLPAAPVTPPVPKIEIIQGDQITQKADEEPQIVMPTAPTGGTNSGNVPLPVIPSRSTSSSQMPQASQPLEGAPFVGSNVIRPPEGN